MKSKTTPLFQFISASIAAMIIGTTFINGGIVKSAQATLMSVAVPGSQSITSATWKVVIDNAVGSKNATLSTYWTSYSLGASTTRVVQCGTTTGNKNIYLTPSSTSGLANGMTVRKASGTLIGTISNVNTSSNCNGNNRVRIQLQNNALVQVNASDVLTFKAADVETGRNYYQIMTLNNTGSRDISAVTFAHTSALTSLTTCTQAFSADTCTGTMSAVTPGSSVAISIASGSSAYLKVSRFVAVGSYVTPTDTISVVVGNSQIPTTITNS